MTRLLAVLLLMAGVVFTGAGAQTGPRPPVTEVIRQLQARYAGITDFTATFEHTYAGGVLQTTDTEHGVMSIKKPGRWRFDYSEPEEKLFVSDGTTIHSYFPADRQVIVSPLPPLAEQASTPMLFLAGIGDLTRDFSAAFASPPDADRAGWRIQLTPTRAADYEQISLVVDPDRLEIRQMSTTDFQGGVSTYVFSNLEENQGLSDDVFTFDVPRGVEVLTDDSFLR